MNIYNILFLSLNILVVYGVNSNDDCSNLEEFFSLNKIAYTFTCCNGKEIECEKDKITKMFVFFIK